MRFHHHILRWSALLATAPLLTGCFSSSSDSDSFEPGSCSAADQNAQLIEYLEERYLWASELPANIDPTAYNDVYELLADVRVPQDTFSFIMTEEEYQQRYVDAVFFGFGFGREDRPEQGVLQVRYVYDHSPADAAGLNRGDEIIEVAGRAVSDWFNDIQSGSATWDDAFGPNEPGITVEIGWREPDGTEYYANLTKEEVSTNTIMHTERFQQDDSEIGYFVFDSFIERSESDLNDAYDALIGVDELVIDLRYNSGGLVRVANQLSSQASWEQVEHEIFFTYQYNEQREDRDILFDLGPGIERLNLERVYVLTTGASCSASELVINGLSPFVEVVTIGSPTCGKPVGQEPTQICDKIVMPITFQTVNAAGDGDYFDGLPVDCPAPDSIVGDWGVPGDPLLANALHHTSHNSCATSGMSQQLLEQELTRERDRPQRHPLLEKFSRQH